MPGVELTAHLGGETSVLCALCMSLGLWGPCFFVGKCIIVLDDLQDYFQFQMH